MRTVFQFLVLCLLSLPGSSPAAVAKPNLLFILADDHRADGLGALGNLHLKTPNLDRLVEHGTSFSRAYVFGSTMGAVCLPSRSMIATGRTLFRLPPNLRQPLAQFEKENAGAVPALLPRVLSAAGYETFHVGKSGNECRFAIEACDQNIVQDDRTEELRRGSSQRHAEAVIKFLRERKREKPFYIYLAPPVPHDPRVCPKEFLEQYDPAKIPVPASFLPVHPFDNGDLAVRDERLAPWPRTAAIVQRHRADYYACIANFDHHVGRIFDTLKALGQFENTIIIFAGDNGLSLGEHGLFGKQNLYEFGGLHVPLVFAGPGIVKGRSEALVYLLDLFPTFCELAGAPVPAAAEGRSLAPLLRGQSPPWREVLFTAYNGQTGHQRAVRDARWKVLRYPQVDVTQLFDLQADPHELNNLAGKAEHAGKVKEMLALLEREQKRYGDPSPLTVANPKPSAWTPPAAGGEEGSNASSARARRKKGE